MYEHELDCEDKDPEVRLIPIEAVTAFGVICEVIAETQGPIHAIGVGCEKGFPCLEVMFMEKM